MKPVSNIAAAEESLRSYCERMDFQGWDPWDALASPLFRIFPFNLRLPRWAGNHLIKISPINIRPLLGIRQDCFAKGLALFLSAYVLRGRTHPDPATQRTITLLYERLMEKTIPGFSGPCWGTNVAYQTRAFFVPGNTPSAVHTAFAVEAILDLNEMQPDAKLVHIARGACEFILNDLHIKDSPEGICFSYTPQDRSRVINVTALVARMLARTGRISGVPEYLERARAAARFVISRQESDGSWMYGEDPIHHWIDNYHTGFVLEALEDYRRYTDDDDVDPAVNKGAEFYRKRLFLEDGTPKFSPGSVYPIDGHCIAQGILTFVRLKDRDPDFLSFAERIAGWGIRRFQDRSGYFYFQRRRRWWNRIPYIRWVQAWMLLALNRLLIHEDESRKRKVQSSVQD
jgi:hypothetical protein